MTRTTFASLGLAVLVASATAAAQTTTPAARPEAAAERGVRGERGERHAWGRAGMRGRAGRDRMARPAGTRRALGVRALFAGVELSADQRTRLHGERARLAPRTREAQAQATLAHAELKAARLRGDTVASAAARARVARLQADRQTLRQAHIAGVRAVLTPAQRTRFDENVTRASQRLEPRRERGMRGQDARRGEGRRERRPARGGRGR